jgi:hypothetical protein
VQRVVAVWCVLATSAWSLSDAGVESGVEVDGGVSPDSPPLDPGVDAGVSTAVPLPVAAPVLVPERSAKPVKKAKPEPEPARPLDLSFLAVLLPVTPALSSIFYDLSAVYSQQGYGFAEGPMTLTGFRFVERNSGLGKLTAYVVTQLFLAMGEAAAASGLVQKHLGTEYRPGYRIDYYQRFSNEEVAAMRRSREATGDSMLSSNMSLDLQLYLPVKGVTTSSGFSVELTPFTLELADSGEVGLELGIAYTRLTDLVPGSTRERTYDNLGLPLRFMANWRFIDFQLQWVPNFLGGFGFDQDIVEKNYVSSLDDVAKPIFYNNSPLSLSVTLHPLRWLFVRGTGSWNRYQFNLNSLGFQLEAGLRL